MVIRWTIRIGAAAILAWLILTASPYVALYNLTRAIESRDIDAIEARTNLRAVRASITRQVVAAYVDVLGGGRGVDPAYRQMASEAAATVVEPLVAQLFTPGGILDLLDDGWPQAVSPTDAAPPGGLRIRSVGQALRLFSASQSRGFRTAFFSFPLDRPPEQRVHLRLRLSHWTWRLIEIELPAALRESLVQGLPRGRGSAGRPQPSETAIGLRPQLDE